VISFYKSWTWVNLRLRHRHLKTNRIEGKGRNDGTVSVAWVVRHFGIRVRSCLVGIERGCSGNANGILCRVFLHGYNSGLVAHVIANQHFLRFFDTKQSASIVAAVVSVFAGGCVLGSLCAGLFLDLIGRKRYFMICSVKEKDVFSNGL
jgi:hypothetical protein